MFEHVPLGWGETVNIFPSATLSTLNLRVKMDSGKMWAAPTIAYIDWTSDSDLIIFMYITHSKTTQATITK